MSFLMGLNFHATDLTQLDPRISAMVGECCRHHDGHVVLIEMVWSYTQKTKRKALLIQNTTLQVLKRRRAKPIREINRKI